MRRAAILAALPLAVAAPALAWQGPKTARGNLDTDKARETVRSVRVDRKGVEDAFDQTRITVTDTCDGEKVTRRIAGPQDNLVTVRLKRADTRPGREVFVDMRSGNRSLLGEARLVAWRDCKPHNVFRYKTDKPTGPPEGATRDLSSFAISVRNLERRFKGLEVVLDERYLGRNDPPCCGTFQKLSYYRYDRGRDKYVRYDLKTARKKIGQP